MVYNNYTLRADVQALVTYCCPKCNVINDFESKTRVSATYNNKGALTKGNLESRKESARDSLISKRIDLEAKIRDEDKKGLYRHITLRCKCGKCGHEPIWAKICKLNILDAISKIGVYILVIVAAFVMLGVMDSATKRFIDYADKLIIPGVLMVGPQIIKLTIRTVWEIKIKKMDPVYLPRICWREEEFLKKRNALMSEVQNIK